MHRITPRTLKVVGLLALAAGSHLQIRSVYAAQPQFITFDIPDPDQFVQLVRVNNSGEVAIHSLIPPSSFGYIRHKDGTFTKFSPPGSQLTYVLSINNQGAVAGHFFDSLGHHGYVRETNGSLRVIDVPGATETQVTDINDNGDVTGGWVDANPGAHGFVLSKNGNLVSFDILVSLDDPTLPFSFINNRGDVAGVLEVGNGIQISFFRSKDGQIVPLMFPGTESTAPADLNDRGEVVGIYNPQQAASVNPGFLRHPDGTYTSLGNYEPYAINNGGEMAGLIRTGVTSPGVAFVRKANGVVETFQVPGSSPNSTFPSRISDSGIIAGTYADSDGFHGFIRK